MFARKLVPTVPVGTRKLVPMALLGARKCTMAAPIPGSYNYLTQKWSSLDVTAADTWCRSTTTGTLPLQISDPDEDRDD